MEINLDQKVWFQASGAGREYWASCFEWDVILNGPGNHGPFDESRYLSKVTKHKSSDLLRFKGEMHKGDLVLLRSGIKVIKGVGIIHDDSYSWNEIFSDMDGWDLQHVRRVEWIWKDKDGKRFEKAFLSSYGPDTTLRANLNKKVQIKEWIESLNVGELSGKIKDLPLKQGDAVSDEQISEHLESIGLTKENIGEFLSTLSEIRKRAKWYATFYADKNRNEATPSEYETVTYLIMPLLHAIGWSYDRMAIGRTVGGKRPDITFFSNSTRSNEAITMLLEAKRKDFACLTAEGQATYYASICPSANRIIVTSGTTFGILIRDKDEFKIKAYLNLLDPRTNYPVYKCGGALEALSVMRPDWQQV